MTSLDLKLAFVPKGLEIFGPQVFSKPSPARKLEPSMCPETYLLRRSIWRITGGSCDPKSGKSGGRLTFFTLSAVLGKKIVPRLKHDSKLQSKKVLAFLCQPTRLSKTEETTSINGVFPRGGSFCEQIFGVFFYASGKLRQKR